MFHPTERISRLKQRVLTATRFASIEQARLITASYRTTEGEPRPIRRAKSFAHVAEHMEISIDPDELIVGNRTAGIRAGVVFPESGLSWVDAEFETLPTRSQDRFEVRDEDIREFRKDILPYWKGRTLEDAIFDRAGSVIEDIKLVVKINQKDHAQGHICPNTKSWLRHGPSGLIELAEEAQTARSNEYNEEFYESVRITLEAARAYMQRYAQKAEKKGMGEISRICDALATRPPQSFHEALQSMWFLYVLLQLESNASSFSPGRADQYLYEYYRNDLDSGVLDEGAAQELVDALCLKFNEIVYLRNRKSAEYFAGFPIGFNVAIGGQTRDRQPAENDLSYHFLTSLEHLHLPQPNLSARLYKGSTDRFVRECSRVIGLGTGMPQIFSDEAVIPALEARGISKDDAINYAIVGCVELTTHGNNLGWSDAAMYNLVKALELTLNNGVCMLTGKRIGLPLGTLVDFIDYDAFEHAFAEQLKYFISRMIDACETVDRLHAELLPSPFLSSVIDDCLATGVDVTAGGAHYNFSGIQAIQVANLADSLAAIRKLVFDDGIVAPSLLLDALKSNFEHAEELRRQLIRVPKYGNDVAWVDDLGARWIEFFSRQLEAYTNVRGGPYHAGLYTVSAHVPMGHNTAATPDGRRASEPLADGGMSAMYGRDVSGPTALLHSVSRIDSRLGSNGTLLNMKFLPEFFESEQNLDTFSSLLRTLSTLKIPHVQFNVVRKEDLVAAKRDPDRFRSLTVRVAGYTAYFTELSEELQDEIIARTTYGKDG